MKKLFLLLTLIITYTQIHGMEKPEDLSFDDLNELYLSFLRGTVSKSKNITTIERPPLENRLIKKIVKYAFPLKKNYKTQLTEYVKALVKTLDDHINYVNSVAFSPDNNYLASGSHDSTVKIYNLNSIINNHKKRPFSHISLNEVKGQFVSSVAFSPNNNYLAFGSGDGTVKIYNFNSIINNHKKRPFPPISLNDHQHFVLSVAFSPNSNYLASGSMDGTVKIYNLNSIINNHKKRPFPHISLNDHKGKLVSSVAFSPNSNYLASGSKNKIVNIYNLNSIINNHDNQPFPHISLNDHKGKLIGTVAFSPDSNYLAFGSGDNTVTIYNLDSIINNHDDQSFPHISLNDHDKLVKPVAFSPNNNYLASGSGDGTVKIYDLNSIINNHDDQSFPHISLNDHDKCVGSVAFSPNNNYLASGSEDRTVKIYDLRNIKILLHLLKNKKLSPLKHMFFAKIIEHCEQHPSDKFTFDDQLNVNFVAKQRR